MMNITYQRWNRIISISILSMFIAIASIAILNDGKTTHADATEVEILNTTEVDCFSMDEASVLVNGEGSSIQPHNLYKCKVVKKWKTCDRWVYVSTSTGSYWKCTKWTYHQKLICVPKSHSHNNDF